MPNNTLAILQQRADLIQQFRSWFGELGLLEVEAPILSRSGGSDPQIQNLSTRFFGERLYLNTSPEFAMKRLIAEGSGSIYHIGKAFREDQAGRLHNPEFTLIEWYRVGLEYQQLMDELGTFLMKLLSLSSLKKLTYRDVFLHTVGLDPLTASEAELDEFCQDIQGELTRDAKLDWVLSHHVLSAFAHEAVIVYDYPASQAALSRIRGEVSERFEIIIHGVEIANGYSELTDAIEQRQRFDRDNAIRQSQTLAKMPLDENFLTALEQGMPDCAGVALGLDRLHMILVGATSLAEVNPFMLEQV